MFADELALKDIKTFLARARAAQADRAWVQLLKAREHLILLCTSAVFAPETLTDKMPTVLVQKSYLLQEAKGFQNTDYTAETQPQIFFSEVYELSALTERLQRVERTGGLELIFPPVAVSASWAGVSAPLAGWEFIADVTSEILQEVAKTGAQLVAAAVPPAAGQPLVQQVRGRVWGSSICDPELFAEHNIAAVLEAFPAGAAFALEAAGFCKKNTRVRFLRSGNWLRLAAAFGTVLVRIPFR